MSTQSWRQEFRQFRKTLPREDRGDYDLSLAAFLETKKHALLSSPYYSQTAERRAIAKRVFAKRRSDFLKAELGNDRRYVAKNPKLLLYKVSDDYLRDLLCPRFRRRWVPIKARLGKRIGGEITLSDFSFARNPNGTLEQIREIAKAAATKVGVRLNFLDNNCDDVASYMVLAQVMRALPPVFSGGLVSPEVATVLISVGLDKMLGMGRLTGVHSPYPILPFKMVFRAPPGFFGDRDHQLRPQYKELIADKFCSQMDKWLEAKGFELTESGAESLIVSITEALDNAERHGCPDVDDGLGDWLMGGFARIVHDGESIQRIECSVSIVSVGATIAESLGSAGPKVSGLVEGYSAIQKRQGIDAPLARTIVALQDGITRVESASQAQRGGIGLLTLAEIFADLGETDQKDLQSVFTIISGNSCLRLTTPYRKGVARDGTTLRNLWFNERNDGNMRPDPNHAYRIDHMFGGTVLSACFCIDPTYLQRKLAA